MTVRRAIGVGVLAALPAFVAAQASAPDADPAARRAPRPTAYDGAWGVSVDCPTSKDGALGYTLELEAKVENGVLRGERGHEGQASWLKLEGRVRDDGTLSLVGRGTTGDSKFSAGSQPIRTPYAFRAAGRLEPTRGEAVRNDVRVCNLLFVKR